MKYYIDKRLYFVVFLVVAILLTTILALQTQLIFKRAAAGEVTVNLVPTTSTSAIGQEFNVAVYLYSGDLKVSGATIHLNVNSALTVVSVIPEIGTGKAFTDFVEEAGIQNNILPITLLAKKATGQLPSGNIKFATVVLRANAPITDSIVISPETSEVIGYNQTNEDVSFTVRAGTSSQYAVTGNLCKLSTCPANIMLSEEARTDGKLNINVSWTAMTGTNLMYKVYRNKDSSVPITNPDANLIGTTTAVSFWDTNKYQGFNGLEKYYYNVDAYQPCE